MVDQTGKENLFKKLLVEFARYTLPLGASCLKLLGCDPDVLHITAQHEVHLGEFSIETGPPLLSFPLKNPKTRITALFFKAIPCQLIEMPLIK